MNDLTLYFTKKPQKYRTYQSTCLSKRALSLIEKINQAKRTYAHFNPEPPFEGSLQERSYPKFTKVTPEHSLWLLKVTKLINAYKGDHYHKTPAKSLTPHKFPSKKLPDLVSNSSEYLKSLKPSVIPSIKKKAGRGSFISPQPSGNCSKLKAYQVKYYPRGPREGLTAWEIVD